MEKLLSLYLVFFVLPLFGKNEVWLTNKDHSQIIFQVDYLTLSKVDGRFTRFNGRLSLDSKGNYESLKLIIDADSIYTANSMRDGHLKGSDFLEVKKYPFIIFKSNRIKRIKDRYQVEGSLKVKGISKKEIINIKISPKKKDTWGFISQFVSFEHEISRKKYGLTWDKKITDNQYLIGNTISLKGSFQIQPRNKITPKSKHMIPITRFTKMKEKVLRGEMSEDEFILERKKIKPALIKSSSSLEKQKGSQGNAHIKKSTTNIRDTLGFQLSLYCLGFLGFISSIIISFTIKDFFIKILPTSYEETNLTGILSDILTYIFIGLYVVSFWYLGWG